MIQKLNNFFEYHIVSLETMWYFSSIKFMEYVKNLKGNRNIFRKDEGCMNFSVGDKRYIISDAAKMIEVESHVLRYWEEELEVEVPRNEMGHRYYTNYYIELFKKIKELKDSGFQLKAIKMILPELMEINGNSAETSTYGTLKDELFEKLMRSSEDNVITKNENEENANNAGFMSGYINQAIQEQIVVEKIQPEHQEKDIGGTSSMIQDTVKKDIEKKENDNNSINGVKDKTYEENVIENMVGCMDEKHDIVIPKSKKIEQFQMIIMEVVSNALKENNGSLGREVSDIVSDHVIKEMDFLLQMKERQEEERFRKLDQLIRNYQTQNKEKSREKTKSNKGLFAKLKKL